jgi:hypothetical protein
MRSGERRDVSRLFDGVRLLPVTDAVARRAGRHPRRSRRSHPGNDLADYLIAATAEEEAATLVTLNVKHFPMIEGLHRDALPDRRRHRRSRQRQKARSRAHPRSGWTAPLTRSPQAAGRKPHSHSTS